MDTKADMDGAMVELPGGIEAIRALDSAQTEGARIEARSEQLRKRRCAITGPWPSMTT